MFNCNQDCLMEINDDFEIHMDLPGDALSAIKAVGKYIYKRDKEHSFLIMLDEKSMPIGTYVIGVGTSNTVPMGIAEIFRVLTLTGACGYITMHNHPAGTFLGLRPSIGDNNNTDRLIQLSKMTGIVLVDDIIVTREANGPVYFSNREAKTHHPNMRKISPEQVGEFRLNEEPFPPLPAELAGWEDNPLFLSHYTDEELQHLYPDKNFSLN